MIFISKRNVANFFEITKEEREEIFYLVDEVKKLIRRKYSTDV